jgi:RND family efflux transporter MFP subunit
VQLSVPAYPGENFDGRVVTVAPNGDPRAHTFDARIVPANQDQRLLPGMFAQVQVVAAQKPDAILVPREAIVRQGTSSVVFVNNEGKAEQRQVQTGLSDNTSVEIVSGVAPGEQVVVVGQNSLHDGTPIQVVTPR